MLGIMKLLKIDYVENLNPMTPKKSISYGPENNALITEQVGLGMKKRRTSY